MLNAWHNLLKMEKHDKAWHDNDLADELAEYNEETRIIMKWSGLSDVTYTYSRGKWAGHEMAFPFNRTKFLLGTVYMLPKYTLRWLFFKSAGDKAGSKSELHEVRNPKKTAKLHHIAKKYDIPEDTFQVICEKQLKRWILLP